jgi:hypothetical protein
MCSLYANGKLRGSIRVMSAGRPPFDFPNFFDSAPALCSPRDRISQACRLARPHCMNSKATTIANVSTLNTIATRTADASMGRRILEGWLTYPRPFRREQCKPRHLRASREEQPGTNDAAHHDAEPDQRQPVVEVIAPHAFSKRSRRAKLFDMDQRSQPTVAASTHQNSNERQDYRQCSEHGHHNTKLELVGKHPRPHPVDQPGALTRVSQSPMVADGNAVMMQP